MTQVDSQSRCDLKSVAISDHSKLNKISAAIDQLGAGLTLAYKMVEQNYVKGDVNRILLATDGDFNLGVSIDEELKAIVKREREKGITLSTLGFGSGNYIDSVREADKVLGDEIGATLITVAKNCATIPPYQIPPGQALPLGQRWAMVGKGNDDKGYRAEFVRTVNYAARLSK
jgi:hypothetical protein